MLVRNPDARDSLAVERDDRRWQDNQLHGRITKLTQELVSLEDYASLLSARLSEIATDLANERATRLSREQELAEAQAIQRHHLQAQIDEVSGLLTLASQSIRELQDQVVILGERTWWSMLKESVRRLFHAKD